MEYTFVEKNDRINVRVFGNLTPSSRAQIHELRDRAVAVNNKQMFIELSDMEYLDSMGVGMFLELGRAVSRPNCKIVLEGANDMVAKILDLTKMDTFFEVRS